MWLRNPDCPICDEQWRKTSFDCLALQYSRKYSSGYSREYAGLSLYLISELLDRCNKYRICMKIVDKRDFLENGHIVFEINKNRK